jgi:Flp pilus assembly protein TadG
MNQRPVASKPRDRGAVAVEFALLLPILLLLLFGIVDFGRALNAQITLTQLAREGARLYALGVASGTVTTKTQNAALAARVSPVTVTFVTTACPLNAAAGVDATVKVSYTFSYITPVAAIAKMFGSINFGSSVALTAQCEMPCET